MLLKWTWGDSFPFPLGISSTDLRKRIVGLMRSFHSHWVSRRPGESGRSPEGDGGFHSHWVSRRPSLFSTYCLYKSRAFWKLYRLTLPLSTVGVPPEVFWVITRNSSIKFIPFNALSPSFQFSRFSQRDKYLHFNNISLRQIRTLNHYIPEPLICQKVLPWPVGHFRSISPIIIDWKTLICSTLFD